jgi:hypothetical protein
MPSRRTIKKPTRWTPEEWRHIEEAAQRRGVPPLRYVREAALAAKLPPRVRRRGSHELVKQLVAVLNNLHQLERVAQEEAAHLAAAAIQTTIRLTDDAVRAASGRPGSAHPLIIAVRDAGRFLNEVTHHAHVIEELPADEELDEALHRIQLAVRDVLR